MAPLSLLRDLTYPTNYDYDLEPWRTVKEREIIFILLQYKIKKKYKIGNNVGCLAVTNKNLIDKQMCANKEKTSYMKFSSLYMSISVPWKF